MTIRPRGPAGRGGQQLPPGAEGLDPALLAQFGFGPGAANGNIVPPPPAGTNFRLVAPQRVHCHSAVTCGLLDSAVIGLPSEW